MSLEMYIMLIYSLFLKQLITEFVKKEKIPLDGVQSAEILLGRDTRPSGESLLEAPKQVSLLSITTVFAETLIIFFVMLNIFILF